MNDRGTDVLSCPPFVAALVTDAVLLWLAGTIWPGLRDLSRTDWRFWGLLLFMPLLLLWGLLFSWLERRRDDGQRDDRR